MVQCLIRRRRGAAAITSAAAGCSECDLHVFSNKVTKLSRKGHAVSEISQKAYSTRLKLM